jgi:hypothetical protein
MAEPMGRLCALDRAATPVRRGQKVLALYGRGLRRESKPSTRAVRPVCPGLLLDSSKAVLGVPLTNGEPTDVRTP